MFLRSFVSAVGAIPAAFQAAVFVFAATGVPHILSIAAREVSHG